MKYKDIQIYMDFQLLTGRPRVALGLPRVALVEPLVTTK